jgi:glycine/D-amino acid oxidase-like deaminating enzyme
VALTWRAPEVLCAGSWTARFLPVACRAHLRARRVPLSWFAARHPEEFTPRWFPIPVRTDSFTDLYSPDGTPLVARTTAGGQLLVAAGFSGRGFRYAPALAAVVADALVAGTNAPLGVMSPGRLSRETGVAGPLPR